MAIVRYKGKTTVTTPVRSKGTSGSDASSARIASERAMSGKTSMTGERTENAAQRKARLGMVDTADGGVAPIDPTEATPLAPENVAQPNPVAPQAPTPTTPQVPFDQALKGLGTGATREQVGSLAQKYQQGLATTQGMAVPPTMGGANTQIQGSIPPPAPDTSEVDLALAEDKGWQGLQEQFTEYFSPENQKVSLMDTYNKLFKKSGLDQLDEEIIDAQTIIDGTEDDIRNEIEQAGGFGTDSQVQALALSRNKVLLKNYNNLVALRESKATNLDRMMNFAEKDRTYADNQFDRMLNYQTQMLNYRDKFIQNARDQYNKYDPAQLNAMLQGNPRQLAFAEQIMGLGQGGLAKLASMPPSEMESLQLQNQRLQNRKLLNDINAQGMATSPVSTQNSIDQFAFLRKTVQEAKDLSGASGVSGLKKKFGDWFVGDTKFRQLEAKTNTLRTNVLTLMTDPNIKKFFGPQMTNRDVELITSAGTTLNPESNSPTQMTEELGRLDDLLNRMETAVKNGSTSGSGQSPITAPDGTQVIIVD